MGKTLTGLHSANVRTDDDGTAFVKRGEELPDNLKDGEEKRLEKLGAFDDPADSERERRARLLSLGIASAPTPEKSVVGLPEVLTGAPMRDPKAIEADLEAAERLGMAPPMTAFPAIPPGAQDVIDKADAVEPKLEEAHVPPTPGANTVPEADKKPVRRGGR
jgi:hypothetical protein